MIEFSNVRERSEYKVSETGLDRVVPARVLQEEFDGDLPPVPKQYFAGFDQTQPTRKLQERLGAIIEEFPTAKDDTVLSFLLDSRGGMRGWPLVAFAGISGLLTRELDTLGIKHEILSHTTNDWKISTDQAARLRAERGATGSQFRPGRVGSLLHVIWKEVDATVPDLDSQLAQLGNMRVLKDNIDGEAIEWAYKRLAARSEPNKLLLTIKSDSLNPISQGTELYNGSDVSLLHRHLLDTVSAIKSEGDVHLSAVILSRNSKVPLFDERGGGVSDKDVIAAYDGIYSCDTFDWDDVTDVMIEAVATSMRRSLELKTAQTPSP